MRTAIRLLPNQTLDECAPWQHHFADRDHRRASARGLVVAAAWILAPLAVVVALSATSAHAQRMQFATPIEPAAVGALGAVGGPSSNVPAPAGSYTGSTGWVPASSSRNSSTAWGNGYTAAAPQGQYGQSYGAAPGSYPPGGYGATAAPNNFGGTSAPGSYPSGGNLSGSGTGSWPSAPGLLPSQGGAAPPAAGYGASPYTAPAAGYGTPSTGYGAPAPSYGAPAGGYAAPASPYGGTGAMAGSPAAPYASPSSAAPYGYPNPAAPSGFGAPAPYGYSGPSTPPNALLDGTVYGPPPQWDPWAPPSTAPPSLLPYDPYYSPAATAPGLSFMGSAQRFLRMLKLDYVWMPGKGDKEMGINDIDASATFNIPFLYNSQTPLMITPGFGATFFSGPTSPEATEVPPHVFDAYLESGWNPQLTQWFGGELSFRVGVHSDFEKVVSDSIRYQAKGMAVLNFSPSIKVKAGVWYLDRVHLKLLPAGGIVWIPNNDVVLQLTFPDPKIARRLSTVGTTEWWIYGRGEYGGDVWTTSTPTRGVQLFDYNDIRVGLGFEFFRPAGLHGAFEVGAAFDREVYFRNDPRLHLSPCVYLRGLLTY